MKFMFRQPPAPLKTPDLMPATPPLSTLPTREIVARVGGLTRQTTLYPLASSLLEAAGQVDVHTLILVFRALPGSAAVAHAYDGVPPEVLQQILSAPSPGKFYTSFIWNRYPSTPVILTE